jgi:hypothetical protein
MEEKHRSDLARLLDEAGLRYDTDEHGFTVLFENEELVLLAASEGYVLMFTPIAGTTLSQIDANQFLAVFSTVSSTPLARIAFIGGERRKVHVVTMSECAWAEISSTKLSARLGATARLADRVRNLFKKFNVIRD